MNAPEPLRGRRVVVTRAEPGRLGEMLEARGAIVVHVPLVTVVDPADGGAELDGALAGLDGFDWLVVTSPAGARRVAAAAARTPGVRLAAVGSSTADALAGGSGRTVDLVPDRQHAAALAAALAELPPSRVLLALADRAPDTLQDRLDAAGHTVTRVTAYRTVAVPPAGRKVDPPPADALLLASGSAAEAWVEHFGSATPPIVVAIGPSTAAAATRSGLKVSAIADDHSVNGLVAELAHRLDRSH